jgi:hypothetical protein
MSDSERELELWQQAAASGQPDEKRRRGIAQALQRYYEAVGLRRTGRRHGEAAATPGVDPVEPIRGSE